ncbi:sigma-70 family RNA polymerase sigma factor [Candidatus Woesearchaeota archaeon]|jgi:RNA polymerase primary sigma factor|nr:sigma-70 family RNA polymerase sigma factor [Candidatus Woesearchaeota archaeon]
MRKFKSKNEEDSLTYEIGEKSDLDYYFNLIQKYPLLSSEEEAYLFRKSKEGDKEAKEKLILSNLRLVIWVTKKYSSKLKEIPMIDLISEGNIGLIKSIERYNPEKYKNKFSTYAIHWINQKILKYINDTSNIIHFPNQIIKHKKLFESILENSSNSNKSLDSLLINLNLNEKFVKKIKSLPICSSYDFYANELTDQKDKSFEELSITNNSRLNENEPFDETLNKFTQEKIYSLLNQALNEKEKKVIFLRYGLAGNKEHTLKEVSKQLNLSRERIRQIQEKALEKLRRSDLLNKIFDFS